MGPAGPDQPRQRTPSSRPSDPFAEVKASVHQALIDNLGPKLYDPRLEQAELEQRVRQTLQQVLEQEETPLSTADRGRLRKELADEVLGHGPLEPLLATPPYRTSW